VSQERLKAVLFRNDDAGSEDHFVTPF
jgi:hypothetical protein